MLPYKAKLPISNNQAYYSRTFDKPEEYEFTHTVYYTRNANEHLSKETKSKIFVK